MYVDVIHNVGSYWAQAAIKFPSDRVNNDKIYEEWWRSFNRLVRGLDTLSGCESALRVILTEDNFLTRALFCGVPEELAFDLRRYISSFSILETFAKDSAQIPNSYKEHCELLAVFPRRRLRTAVHGFTAGEAWFACDYQVMPFLDDLLSEANFLHHTFGYQIQFYPLVSNSERLRAARKNLLTIEELPGASDTLIRHQHRLVEKLHNASAIYEEFVGVDSPQAAMWLISALRRRFEQVYSPLKFETPTFNIIDDGYADSLMRGRHTMSNTAVTLDEICASAVDNDTRFNFLSWCPAPDATKRSSKGMLTRPESEADSVDSRDAKKPAQKQTTNRISPVNDIKSQPVEVFISYSHADKELKDELIKHLSGLRRLGFISEWHDRKIRGGTEWKGEIDARLNAARVVLILISSDFLYSDYCFDVEMKQALARHEAREARVIPILLRSVDWSDYPFARLQALPTDGRPVMNWSNRDQAFENIAKGIRDVVKELITTWSENGN